MRRHNTLGTIIPYLNQTPFSAVLLVNVIGLGFSRSLFVRPPVLALSPTLSYTHDITARPALDLMDRDVNELLSASLHTLSNQHIP